MDKVTAEALEKSIEHWKKNANAENPGDVRTGVSDCALCDVFYGKSCYGCPVRVRTNLDSCLNSPYGEARDWLIDWYKTGSYNASILFKDAALAEVAFLESLREPVEEE